MIKYELMQGGYMSSKPFHLFGSPSRNDSVVVKDEILSVQHLVKKYGDLTAVNDISFSVKKNLYLLS